MYKTNQGFGFIEGFKIMLKKEKEKTTRIDIFLIKLILPLSTIIGILFACIVVFLIGNYFGVITCVISILPISIIVGVITGTGAYKLEYYFKGLFGLIRWWY